MIWLLAFLVVVAAAFEVGRITKLLIPSRALAVLAGVGMAVIGGFLSLAIAFGSSAGDPTAGFSHDQLEADRVMTQQMSVVTGPSMDAQMTDYGMLRRTSDEAYLKALEAHTAQLEQMLGRGG